MCDPKREIMVAYGLVKGKEILPLPPDQGYPVRLVCPGLIEARSVKWLSEIHDLEFYKGKFADFKKNVKIYFENF